MTVTYIIDNKRKTQTDLIREHLLAKGTITNVEAAAMFKARSLTKRVAELRDQGYDIASEWRRDSTGQRYVRYWLRKKEADRALQDYRWAIKHTLWRP
jgi:hypothetical protein